MQMRDVCPNQQSVRIKRHLPPQIRCLRSHDGSTRHVQQLPHFSPHLGTNPCTDHTIKGSMS
jgi:hypothetical protein